jgi:hypothetical protein
MTGGTSVAPNMLSIGLPLNFIKREVFFVVGSLFEVIVDAAGYQIQIDSLLFQSLPKLSKE